MSFQKTGFWDEIPFLCEELQEVNRLVRQSWRGAPPRVRRALDSLEGSGGKRLRPAFVLLGGRFGKSYNREATLPLAAAVEILHLASLIHDDILDEALHRRGVMTLHRQLDVSTAVIAGDYLFTRCFALLRQRPDGLSKPDQGSMDLLFQSVDRLCSSEMDQDLSERGFFITEKEYRSRIAGKTASLFAAALTGGARENQAPRPLEKRLRRIGFKTGMAFQMMDDVLDYEEEGRAGKIPGADLRSGVPNLPLIYTLADERNQPSRPLHDLLVQRKAADTLSPEDQRLVLDLVRRGRGILQARQRVAETTREALALTQDLPGGEAREALAGAIGKLLNREQ